jgi:hypothetical protein
MPTYNFTFKIECGTRTETKVILEETSVNTKTMKFKSGLVKTNTDIAFELQHHLTSMINEIEQERKKTVR